jgi:hypothetical protein
MKTLFKGAAIMALLIGFTSVLLVSCGSSSSPSSPSATATPTVTYTPTLTCNNAINYGYTATGSSGTKANTFIQAEVVTFSLAVTVHALSVDIGPVGGGNTVLGLYTDNSGAPGTLIASGIVNDTASGYNAVSFTPVALSAGNYWLAFENSANSTEYVQNGSSVAGSQVSSAYNGTLPSTWTGGVPGTITPYNLVAQACY